MAKSLAALRQRVQEIMPDLVIEQFERNLDGTINDIVIVNNRWVFRFAKAEKYYELLAREQKLLELIRPHVGVAVPAVAYACADCWVYPLLQGQPLDRIRVRRYDEATQGQLAGQLGVFLRQLHHIDISAASANIPNTHAPVSQSRWLEIQAAVRTQIYPLLQRFQVEYLDDLFDRALDDPQFFDYAPTLIHGDLASYHILFDPEQRQITGVIDFGMAGVGDPANDFGLLISIYGEAFVRRMRPAYPNLDHYLPRARL
jgi:aminoglycoside 2''-phosphotransferase